MAIKFDCGILLIDVWTDSNMLYGAIVNWNFSPQINVMTIKWLDVISKSGCVILLDLTEIGYLNCINHVVSIDLPFSSPSLLSFQ